MRKKGAKPTTDLLENLAVEPRPAVEEKAVLPGLLEYTPTGSEDLWRVQLFELFQAEFALPQPYAQSMALFQETVEPQVRGWMIARFVYGITPVIIPANVDPAEMEAMTREAVCTKLGIAGENLQAELDAVRALWNYRLSALEAEAAEAKPSPSAERGELQFNETRFSDYGFSDAIFEVKRRDATTNNEVERSPKEKETERNWFIRRVCEWGRMLEEPMVSALVRQALMNELYLRRVETEISMVMPGTDAFRRLQLTKKDIEDSYQEQLEEIKENFPEMNVKGKLTLHGSFSDIKDAIIEYRKDKSTHLIDRMRTAYEIEIECRQSLQKPEAQYRFGLNVYWIESAHGLLDPNWRSKIPQRVLKKMDAGGKAGIEAARQEMDEPLVDLERGVSPDEGSQYPDFESMEEQK